MIKSVRDYYIHRELSPITVIIHTVHIIAYNDNTIQDFQLIIYVNFNRKQKL